MTKNKTNKIPLHPCLLCEINNCDGCDWERWDIDDLCKNDECQYYYNGRCISGIDANKCKARKEDKHDEI